MNAVNYSDLRRNLKDRMDKVYQDHDWQKNDKKLSSDATDGQE